MKYRQSKSRVYGSPLSLARTDTANGWYERGTCATAYGFVQVYRQSDFTAIYFICDGMEYARHFDKSLPDQSLKIQCGKLSTYAVREERGL